MPAPAAVPVSNPSQAAAELLHAGFWRRVAAYLLDNLILIVPMAVVVIALGKREGLATIAQIVIWWAYKAGMESSGAQATLGKKAMGIKVVDMHGERISLARATGRFFASFLSGILLCIGFLMAGFTAKRQALHDMMASTLVVRAGATPDEVREGSGTIPMSGGVWAAVVLILVFPFGIGLLAAIAIPAYQDSAVRAKMSQAIAEGISVRADAASEIWAFKQSASAAAPGAIQPTSRTIESNSQYVKSIVIKYDDGVVVMNLQGSRFSASGIEPDARIIWDSNLKKGDAANWSCYAIGVPNKYLPASCRR
jgi:uncharacterized RDD family membrane protein YckC/Tfp pilus assembly major pilin PilA